MRPPEKSQRSGLAWLLGTIGIGLPWLAALAFGLGLWRLAAGEGGAFMFFAAGAFMIVLDTALDIAMARWLPFASDDPGLNRRTHQLVGRQAIVIEAIRDGRGRIKVGDSVWTAIGPELAAGQAVRIIGAEGSLLEVEPVDQAGCPMPR